ncbi:hypothetical protein KFE25_005018 [Diacronema lutheri]|uniref:Major facilitator superfamily (MFS) profile domain-containing protein n=1 Tax=Diacronema lutheri TaxID=2081491 RepID=A0A8J6C6F4_DIALT|nr:hypothetical protein KFE25_005018 [Diacronema lutheri]
MGDLPRIDGAARDAPPAHTARLCALVLLASTCALALPAATLPALLEAAYGRERALRLAGLGAGLRGLAAAMGTPLVGVAADAPARAGGSAARLRWLLALCALASAAPHAALALAPARRVDLLAPRRALAFGALYVCAGALSGSYALACAAVARAHGGLAAFALPALCYSAALAAAPLAGLELARAAGARAPYVAACALAGCGALLSLVGLPAHADADADAEGERAPRPERGAGLDRPSCAQPADASRTLHPPAVTAGARDAAGRERPAGCAGTRRWGAEARLPLLPARAPPVCAVGAVGAAVADVVDVVGEAALEADEGPGGVSRPRAATVAERAMVEGGPAGEPPSRPTLPALAADTAARRRRAPPLPPGVAQAVVVCALLNLCEQSLLPLVPQYLQSALRLSADEQGALLALIGALALVALVAAAALGRARLMRGGELRVLRAALLANCAAVFALGSATDAASAACALLPLSVAFLASPALAALAAAHAPPRAHGRTQGALGGARAACEAVGPALVGQLLARAQADADAAERRGGAPRPSARGWPLRLLALAPLLAAALTAAGPLAALPPTPSLPREVARSTRSPRRTRPGAETEGPPSEPDALDWQ